MISVMGQWKPVSASSSAFVACLIVLALLAGPLCAPACSGMPCFVGSTAAAESLHCHGMAAHGGSHLSVHRLRNQCELANATAAVLSRPVVREPAARWQRGKFGFAISSAATPSIGDVYARFGDSSASPPLTFQGTSSSPLILRI
jgi:hypothetical protein